MFIALFFTIWPCLIAYASYRWGYDSGFYDADKKKGHKYGGYDKLNILGKQHD